MSSQNYTISIPTERIPQWQAFKSALPPSVLAEVVRRLSALEVNPAVLLMGRRSAPVFVDILQFSVLDTGGLEHRLSFAFQYDPADPMWKKSQVLRLVHWAHRTGST